MNIQFKTKITRLKPRGAGSSMNMTQMSFNLDPCSEHECADGGICQLNEVRAPVCRCGPPCDLVARPGSAVCGSDYNDYVSECALRRESCRTKQELSIVYRGECASGL